MNLYIVRHAWAGHFGDPEYPNDDLRRLTDDGRERFAKMVKKLVKRGFGPTQIATSPLVRCRETADVLAEQIRGDCEVSPHNALAPGSRLGELIEWTNAFAGEDVAWVGHAPDVSDLAAVLIGDGTARIRFRKGAVLAIAFDGRVARGRGELSWMATARLLGC